MPEDPSTLEAELRRLIPTPQDDALQSRLEAAAEGTLTQLTPLEILQERQLKAFAPAGLTPEHLAELEQIFDALPFPQDEKIVRFPRSSGAKPAQRKQPLWAAAAAVALLGAVTALWVPSQTPVTTAEPSHSHPRPTDTARLLPASFDRGITEIQDKGVVWNSGNQPHSMIRVAYEEKVTLKDSNGRTYEVKRPKVKYMLVPEKTD